MLGYVVKGIKASLGIEVADKLAWRQEECLDCLSGPRVILTGGGGRQESQGRGRRCDDGSRGQHVAAAGFEDGGDREPGTAGIPRKLERVRRQGLPENP